MTSAAADVRTRTRPTPAGRAARAAFPVPKRRVALETALVALVALAFAALLYHVWDARWSVPFYEDRSDARSIGAVIKSLSENRWWTFNPRLNFPFGQENYDFPAGGETTQLLVLAALVRLLPNYAWAMNVYYFAGFGVVAAVTFLVVRHLRFGVTVAALVALAYTFLPYHFLHEQSHLTRSTYLTAPLAVLLLLWSMSWRSWFLLDPDPPPGTSWRSNLRRRRVVVALVLAVFIAATETMTTAFTMALLAACAIVGAVRWREPARLAVGGTLIATMAVTFLVVSYPTLHYWYVHGKNDRAGVRTVAESEYYSLKLTLLLLPPGDHRLAPAASLGERAQSGSPISGEGGQYLGILGIIGFVGGIVGLFVHGLRGPPRRDPRPPEHRTALVDNCSLIAVLAFLMGIVGGIDVIFATAGITYVRTWDRIVVIIAIASLLVTATWLERGFGALSRRLRRPTLVVGSLAVALTALALWDDGGPAKRDYAAMDRSWDSDQAFVQAIERRMPTGTAVFQFQAQPYPEIGTLERMADYDHFRGYLHDDGTLRWSYGGVKGRERADWQLIVRNRLGPIGALEPLLGMGYTGYWIDTYSFTSQAAAQLRHDLNRTLRERPIVSPHGRFLFYDLRPFKRRLGLSDQQLRLSAWRAFGIGPPS